MQLTIGGLADIATMLSIERSAGPRRWKVEMIPRNCFLVLFSIAFVLLHKPLTAASQSIIPGTRVSLSVPDNFEIASDFSGIVWRDAGASIVVAEFAASVEKMRASLTRDALASRGMALSRVEEIESAMGPAAIFHISQNVQGIEAKRWILLSGNSRDTVIITANVPALLADEVEPVLRESLLTATWDPERIVDPLEAAGFSVSETDDLRISGSLLGSSLMLTKGGSQSKGSPEDPFIVIVRSTAGVAIMDLSAFAKRRLAETSKLSDQHITAESEITIGGMPAYELVADALDENAVPVVVYQVVALEGRYYYIIQGWVGAGLQNQYVEQFRTIARSLAVQPSSEAVHQRAAADEPQLAPSADPLGRQRRGGRRRRGRAWPYGLSSTSP